MTTLSYDEFVMHVFNTNELASSTIAYQDTVQVLTPTDRGRVMVQEPVWRFLGRDAAGQWTMDSDQTEELYLMARWVTSGWGRNTTGEGRIQTEPEKDVFALVCQVLNGIDPNITWAQAGRLSQAITAGTLGEQGNYDETVGGGVLEEYEFTYAFKVVKLRLLYQWLVENGLIDAATK